jgi:hypothetical protein
MTLDPRVAVWLNIISAVLIALVGATTTFESVFDAHTTALILGILSILLVVVNAVLHSIPATSTPKDAAKFYLGPKPNAP